MKRLLLLVSLLPGLLLGQVPRLPQLPQTGATLALDFLKNPSLPASFSTVRNTTATRFNANALMETVAANTPRFDYDPATFVNQNLLAYSEDLNNEATWLKRNATPTSSTIAGPESITAVYRITENTSAGAHGIYLTHSTTATQTFSIYAKADSRSWLWVYWTGYTSGSAWFNLASGAVGNVETDGTNGTSAAIYSCGNGWYRCSITKLTVGASSGGVSVHVATGNGATSYTGDGASGLFLAGGALVNASAPGYYTRTTGTAVLSKVPATIRGLLIEDARTNYVRNSNDPSTWGVGSAVTRRSNASLAPDGTLTSTVSNSASTNSNTSWATNAGLSNSTTYTRSLYVKCLSTTNASNKTWIFETSKGDGYVVTFFNVATGGVSGDNASSSKIIDTGNGWYRLVQTFTTASSGAVSAGQNYIMGYGSSPDVGTFAIWGAQVEVGGFVTSLMPTTTVLISRAGDYIHTNFDGRFSRTQGTLMARAIINQIGKGSQMLVCIGQGSQQSVYLRHRADGKVFGGARYVPETINADTLPLDFTLGTPNSVAVTYQSGQLPYAVSKNASAGSYTNWQKRFTQNWDRFTLGNYAESGFEATDNYLNGWLQQVYYYPFALPVKLLNKLTQ